MKGLTQVWRAAVPRRWRVRASLAFAELVSAGVRRELATLARGSGPIVIGPWLGEVGFELLYWIPFVAWFTNEFSISQERLVVISRGGVASWYHHVGGRYRDAFDYLSATEFAREHDQRVSMFGEQKQLRPSPAERALMGRVRADLGLGDAGVLHPSTMYRILRPYWWGHATAAWVDRYSRYQTLRQSPEWTERRDSYIAVKFYFNECFPATPSNRAMAAEIVAHLARDNRIISLSTGLQLDDHASYDAVPEHVETLDGTVGLRNNLDAQTAIVARARSFVGTYGGFSYLAPFYGVPSVGMYSREEGFSKRHLDVASSVFRRLSGRQLLTVSSVQDARSTSAAVLQ